MRLRTFVLLLLLTVPSWDGAARAEGLSFLSTQLAPVEEADKMRNMILKEFSGEVNFQPVDDRAVFQSIAGAKTERRPSLIGGLHGDLAELASAGLLDDLGEVMPGLSGRNFVATFIELGRLKGQRLHYIPWMQATYVMVANRQALEYLPHGVDINYLSYDELAAWAENMARSTGSRKLGFPVSSGGLMHRFIQGYLYPSFTGSIVRGFRGPEAVAMWRKVRELWQFVNPRSLTFDYMHEPLISEEVWVAWDHTARLLPALDRRPHDFVVFPAPVGPKGRGFAVVLAGLAIPKGAPDRAAAADLIAYLTRPQTQVITLKSVGFFPVLEGIAKQGLSPGLRRLSQGVTRQASSEDAVVSLLPTGLGDKSREFNTVYMLTFSQIVLRGREIETVLEKQSERLRDIFLETGAACWPPDEPSDGPCPIE